MKLLAAIASTVAVLAACSPSPGAPEAPASAEVPSWQAVNHVELDSAALGANLLGEPAVGEVWVYLPPTYFDGEERFPVVYFLPGYQSTSMGIGLPRDLDTAFASTQGEIVVTIPGVNVVGGSFYVDSSVTGGWETFVVEDVVNYVDETFRTIPEPASRGIAGHSMGGFGALNLAMRHPDVFGSVWAAAPGVFDPDAEAGGPFFANEEHVRRMLRYIDEARGLEGEAAAAYWRTSPYEFDAAYGMAMAPLDEPPYFAYPYALDGDALVVDSEVKALWAGGFGGIDDELERYPDNWAALGGIALDVAAQDENAWIPRGCAYLDAQLTAAGVAHEYEVFDGTHSGRLRERILTAMLDFFDDHLARGAS